MKTNHILSLSLLTMTFSACDKGGAQEACVSACESASGWRDDCGIEGVDCEDSCEASIEEAGGESCEDEQIAMYDCTGGIDLSDVGCTEDDLFMAIAEECFAEATDLGECM